MFRPFLLFVMSYMMSKYGLTNECIVYILYIYTIHYTLN